MGVCSCVDVTVFHLSGFPVTLKPLRPSVTAGQTPSQSPPPFKRTSKKSECTKCSFYAHLCEQLTRVDGAVDVEMLDVISGTFGISSDEADSWWTLAAAVRKTCRFLFSPHAGKQ